MTVVVNNMIPNVFSGETNQDSEPNIAVDPADPRKIVASAFTPDPLGGPNAPIFVSTDRGQTWSTAPDRPQHGRLGDRRHQRGVRPRRPRLRRDPRFPGGLRLNILRTNDVGPPLMTVLVDRTGSGVDQPFVEAARVFRGSAAGLDRVYVGNNDFNGASGRTATVDVSLDGAAATPPPPANFVARGGSSRVRPSGQDLPPIRPAVHIDGTVYAAFIARRTGGTSGRRRRARRRLGRRRHSVRRARRRG